MNHLTALLSLGILVVCSFANPGHAALVAHWRGDNTAVDATGNGHNGIATGVAYVEGVVGDAFSFGGTGSKIIVPADTALEPANFSVSLWVKSALENRLRLVIDSTHGAGQAGWALQINSANNLSFAHGNGSTFPEITSAVDFSDGEFHHVAATFDGTVMRLYIDAATPTTLAYTGVPAPSGRDIQIGSSLPLNRHLEGALDEIRIYNRALSAAEVMSLASVPEPTTAGLLAMAAISTGFRSRRRLVNRC